MTSKTSDAGASNSRVITIVGSLPAFDPENPSLASLAADMLERGTAKHDANTIAAMLDKVGARISFSNDATTIQFSARCLKKDAPLVVSLLAEQSVSYTHLTLPTN